MVIGRLEKITWVFIYLDFFQWYSFVSEEKVSKFVLRICIFVQRRSIFNLEIIYVIWLYDYFF